VDTRSQGQSTERAPADNRSTEKVVMDLGSSVVIKGELSGSEDLTFYSQMEGRIRLPAHTLTIGLHVDIKRKSPRPWGSGVRSPAM
jgi:hypothetical protein